MEHVREKYGTRAQADLKCYIEFADPNGSPKGFPVAGDAPNGAIMIFIKYYDPFASTLE